MAEMIDCAFSVDVSKYFTSTYLTLNFSLKKVGLAAEM